MLNSKVANKYAQALFAIAKERDILAAAQTQLTDVTEQISQQENLQAAFYHPLLPADAKKTIVTQVFGADLDRIVLQFLLYLIDKNREFILPAITEEYVKLANACRHIAVAEVVSAMPLTDGQAKALAAKLGEVTGTYVTLRQKVDARLIGGLVVKLGDKLIDGSVARQLSLLEAALTKTPLTKIGVTG